jgi:ribonuclease PH
MREVKIERGFLEHPQGSALISVGKTRVVCSVMVENSVPPFLVGSGSGWITAEYGMLPGSTNTRKQRERNRPDGRSVEIQRLIGRALRSVVDLKRLGERTLYVDCDVLQADGGTRTASITGAFIALGLAMQKLVEAGTLSAAPLRDYIAAISVGVVDGEVLLDLNYEEDSRAEVDMNFVMTGAKKMVEVQATAEQRPFDDEQLRRMLEFARKGVESLIAKQQAVLGNLRLRQ